MFDYVLYAFTQPALGSIIATIALSALMLITVIFFLITNQKNTRVLRNHFLSILNDMEALDGRTIENLQSLRQAGDKTEDERIKGAIERLASDSESSYMGLWIPAPENYLSSKNILDERGLRALGKNIPYSILALGILATIGLAIYHFILVPIDSRDMLLYIFAPLTISVLGFFLLTISNNLYKDSLRHNEAACSREIERHIPVFNNESGTALLIDNFLTYDRDMKESVEHLSGKVEQLTDKALVLAVRESIETSIKDNIAPSIEESNRAMSDLADEYSRRQVEGLGELAAEFAHELTRSVRDQMAPFYYELNQYTTELNQSKNQVDLALDALDVYVERSTALQEHVDSSISTFNNTHGTWAKDATQFGLAVAQLSETGQKMLQAQSAGEVAMSKQLTALSTDLNSFAETVSTTLNLMIQENTGLKELVSSTEQASRELLKDMSAQNAKMLETISQTNTELVSQVSDTVISLVDTMTSENSESVDKYRLLSTQITQAAMDMQDANDQLHQSMSTLNANLNHSVDHFSTGLSSTVNGTLGDFDRNLAEINGRLAASTAMVRDTVSGLSKTVEQLATATNKLSYRK